MARDDLNQFKLVPNKRGSFYPDRPAFEFSRARLETVLLDNPDTDNFWVIVNEMEGGGWIVTLAPESQVEIDKSSLKLADALGKSELQG